MEDVVIFAVVCLIVVARNGVRDDFAGRTFPQKTPPHSHKISVNLGIFRRRTNSRKGGKRGGKTPAQRRGGGDTATATLPVFDINGTMKMFPNGETTTPFK
jgi:hypothetical protein